MTCIDLFTPHLDFLRGNPPPSPNEENVVLLRMVSNRNEANRFVFYAEAFLTLQGSFLVAEDVNVLFSDRMNFSQRFDVNQPETNGIRITGPDGPLERLVPDLSGNIVARYSNFDCRNDGLIVGTSDFTREIVVLSFEHITRTTGIP
jgi:hypothetical protein